MEYTTTSVRIRFGKPPKKNLAKAGQAAHEFLAALHQNGQIGSASVWVTDNRKWEIIVSLPRPDALARRHFSAWGLEAQRKARAEFGHAPHFELLEKPGRVSYPDWRRARFLYLHTDMFDEHSPVCVPGNPEPIPLYLLPIPYQQRGYLCSWASRYRACDTLWIGCGALEIPAYRQMADPARDLAKEGREFCSLIELATRKRVFYHLPRFIGRRGDEDARRRCPGCGGKWAIPRPKSTIADDRLIGFLCQRCRLVSNDWDWGEGGRNVRIGEWQGRPIPRPRASRKGLIPGW